MKIKLAILETDLSYLNRIVAVFSTKYADKFEVYSFTEQNAALYTLNTAKIDVFLANEQFIIDVQTIPKRCGFAYLVDSSDIETVHDQRAVGKFQKVDLIYKQILSIFSEKTESAASLKFGNDTTKIIVFSSVSGGCGASSLAAACAVNYASRGQKALYLNLEKLGSADTFFSAEGQFNIGDIIFALKSKKTNLPLKLESCVKQDATGVYFYSTSRYALDIMELTLEDVSRLLSELRLMSSYNVIVIDIDFSLSKEMIKVLNQVNAVVWVGDGSEISNTKLYRAYQALSTMEETMDESLLGKISLIYNKFSNKTGTILENIGLNVLGGNPRFEHATTQMVINQLASKEYFARIV